MTNIWAFLKDKFGKVSAIRNYFSDIVNFNLTDNKQIMRKVHNFHTKLTKLKSRGLKIASVGGESKQVPNAHETTSETQLYWDCELSLRQLGKLFTYFVYRLLLTREIILYYVPPIQQAIHTSHYS